MDMVGYSLEIHSGTPFASYMKDEVFKPLAMNSSTFDLQEAWRRQSVALGHPGDGDGMLSYIPMTAAGGMYTSVRDVARCLMMHLNRGRLDGKQFISEKLLEDMTTPQFTVAEQRAGYGLGTDSQLWHDTTAYNHGGGGFGFSAIVKWVPKYGVGVVILSNSINNDMVNLADQALELQVESKTGMPLPKTPHVPFERRVELDEHTLQNLEGTYKGRFSMVRFDVLDGSLQAAYIGSRSAKLSGTTPVQFFDEVSGDHRTWTFDLGPDGKPKGVRLLADYNTEYFVLNDQPRESPGPNRPEWKAWSGVYTTTVVGSVWDKKTGTFAQKTVGPEFAAEFVIRNGYLYLGSGEGAEKLAEWRNGLFFTALGGTVQFQPGGAVISNIVYRKK